MNGQRSEMNNKAPVNRHQYMDSFGSSQVVNKIVKINTDSDHNAKHTVEVITRDANNQKFLKMYKLTREGVNSLINSLQSSGLNNVDIQYISDSNNMAPNGFGAPMDGGGAGFGLTGDEVVTKHPEYMAPNPVVSRDSYKQTMDAKTNGVPAGQQQQQQMGMAPMDSDPIFSSFGGSGMEVSGFGGGNISGNDVSSLGFGIRKMNLNTK